MRDWRERAVQMPVFREMVINRDEDTCFVGAPLLEVVDGDSPDDLVGRNDLFPL